MAEWLEVVGLAGGIECLVELGVEAGAAFTVWQALEVGVIEPGPSLAIGGLD
jgi:hypothetical protein